jgi:hypothetical protein
VIQIVGGPSRLRSSRVKRASAKRPMCRRRCGSRTQAVCRQRSWTLLPPCLTLLASVAPNYVRVDGAFVTLAAAGDCKTGFRFVCGRHPGGKGLARTLGSHWHERDISHVLTESLTVSSSVVVCLVCQVLWSFDRMIEIPCPAEAGRHRVCVRHEYDESCCGCS